MNDEVIDAEVETLPAVREEHAVNLFGDASPVAVVERATEAANALAAVVEQKKLYATISNKKHVTVDGWVLLGSMLGVFPIVEWSRETEDGWEARVVARTRNGDEVGAAEAMCSRKENRWKTADDYAVRSMAQTRAVSKALRHPLGFIMTLAGYSATPEAEMPKDGYVEEGPYETVSGPAPLTLPRNWDEVRALITAYDEAAYDLFSRFGASARKLLFGEDDLDREQKAALFDIAARTALNLRESIDPIKFPPPTEEEMAQAWASQLEGAVLQPEPAPEKGDGDVNEETSGSSSG